MMAEMKETGTTHPKRINMNVSNIFRVADQYSTNNTWALRLNKLYVRYKSCKDHTESIIAKTPTFRKIFLSQQLLDAMDQQKTNDAK